MYFIIFWGKIYSIETKRNNTSEDVFTDNLKRICNMMMMEEMNGAETNTEEKKKRIFFLLFAVGLQVDFLILF